MQTIGYRLGWLVGGLLGGITAVGAHAMGFAGKLAYRGLRPLVSRMTGKAPQVRRDRPAKQQVATVKVKIPQAHVEHGSDPVTIVMSSPYDVADRIVSIRLEPDGVDGAVGVVNLRIYSKLAIVRRDLIISEPHLAALMRGRRHSLREVPYDPVQGLEEVKEATIEEVEKLINELGNRPMSAKRPMKDEFKREAALAKPATANAAPAGPGGHPQAAQLPAVALTKIPEPAVQVNAVGTPVVPKVSKGFTYVGELFRAGAQTVHPAGRSSYEIFEATLRLDNDAELPLRGAELERELLASGCKLGDRVAITPMGKVPVDLGEGKEGLKNLYRVQRISN